MDKKMAGMMAMDRSMMGMSPAGAGMGMNMPMAAGGMNMMMIPRCTMKMEKCKDGMKMMCMATDETAAAMMQNLCTMLAGGMMSMHMMMNGMMMMTCNMMMGMCKVDMTADGVCVTWSCGDAKTCKMIQECCQCMMTMMECGCTCCVCMNCTPMCCATCD